MPPSAVWNQAVLDQARAPTAQELFHDEMMRINRAMWAETEAELQAILKHHRALAELRQAHPKATEAFW